MRIYDLDVEVAASGFTKEQEKEFEKVYSQIIKYLFL